MYNSIKYFTSIVLLLMSIISSAQQKPNIVFMLADDCSYVDLSPYGSKDSKTPTLSQLAKEGMKFTNCYQSSPMCSPTRQNILTGLSPFRSGAYPNHTNVNGDVKSVAHYLKPLGYRVALSGKKHYGPSENFPIEYLGKEDGPDNDPNFNNIDVFLNNANKTKEPFCLFIMSNQPHAPWNKGDTTLFDKSKLTMPPFYPNLPTTRNDYRDYLTEINYLDGQVKRALDLLDKYDLAKNTVFIFASEQGNSLPFAKWSCYNVGLKSALIVRWPGKIEPNTVSNALVEYSDITPTFIDIAGGEPIDGLDGSSILPVLKQQKSEHKKYTYGQMTTRGINNGSDYFPIRSISNGKYRYIINLTPRAEFSTVINKNPLFLEWISDAKQNPRTKELVQKYLYRPSEELYNDEIDPYNLDNLINEKKLSGVKDELKKQLKKWMEYTGDKGLITELLALEHMPNSASNQPIIIDTILHKATNGKGDRNIIVPKDGYYTFYVAGKGEIKVDDKVVVANLHSSKISKKDNDRYGIIGLKKGQHSIYLTDTNTDVVSYSGPSIAQVYLNGNKVKKKKVDDD